MTSELRKRQYRNYRCFVRDNDCHWYLIFVNDKEEFDNWVKFTEDSLDWNGKTFDDCRCQSPCEYVFKELELVSWL
jgi:hypothetical protein